MTSFNGAKIAIGPTHAIRLETTKPSTKVFLLGLILSLTIKILNSFLYNNDFQKTNFIIILRSSILLGVQDFLNLFRKKNENIEL